MKQTQVQAPAPVQPPVQPPMQPEQRRMQRHQAVVIARRIRVALAERDSNLSQLVRQLGWQYSYIHRRMSGDAAWLVSDLWEIANLLGLDAAILMAEPEDPERIAS